MSLLLYSLSVRRPPRPCCRDVKSRCRLRPSRCFWYNSRIPSIEHRDAKRNPKWITTTRGSARRKRFYSAWCFGSWIPARRIDFSACLLMLHSTLCTPRPFLTRVPSNFSLKIISMAIFGKSLSNLATGFSSVKWYTKCDWRPDLVASHNFELFKPSESSGGISQALVKSRRCGYFRTEYSKNFHLKSNSYQKDIKIPDWKRPIRSEILDSRRNK